MREGRSTHREDKGKQILVCFARFSSYILLRVSDAYKGYLYFTGDSILSGFSKNFISLTVSGAARRILSEKKLRRVVNLKLQLFSSFVYSEER